MAEALDLDALEAALAAGTAGGPWRWVDNAPRFSPECRYEVLDDEGSVAVCSDDNDTTGTTGEQRVALIVAAVNALPALLAVARRAAAQEKALRELAEELNEGAGRWADGGLLDADNDTDRGYALGRAHAAGQAALRLRAVLDTQEEA